VAQETGPQWDLREINSPLPVDARILVLVLVGVSIIAVIKLVRAVRISHSKREGILNTRNELELLARSITQWMFVPFFAWALVAAHHMYRLCAALLLERHPTWFIILFELREIFVLLYLSAFVAFGLFLLRWYVLKHLGRQSSTS